MARLQWLINHYDHVYSRAWKPIRLLFCHLQHLGRHDDLAERDGLYAKLWRQQAAQTDDVIDHERLREGPAVAVIHEEEAVLPVTAVITKDGRKDVLAISVDDDSILGASYDGRLMKRLFMFGAPFKKLLMLTDRKSVV